MYNISKKHVPILILHRNVSHVLLAITDQSADPVILPQKIIF